MWSSDHIYANSFLGGGLKYLIFFTPTWGDDPSWRVSHSMELPSKDQKKLNKLSYKTIIWSNYSDLTRPHPKWWFSKGNPLISGKSGLVKYIYLTRIIYNIYYYFFDIEALVFCKNTRPGQQPESLRRIPCRKKIATNWDLPPRLCGVDQWSDLGILQSLGSTKNGGYRSGSR